MLIRIGRLGDTIINTEEIRCVERAGRDSGSYVTFKNGSYILVEGSHDRILNQITDAIRKD